jgi:hypothetical protein
MMHNEKTIKKLKFLILPLFFLNILQSTGGFALESSLKMVSPVEFESPQIQLYEGPGNEKEYPFWWSFFVGEKNQWAPTGVKKEVKNLLCSYDRIYENLKNAKSSQEYSEKLQNVLKNCEEEFKIQPVFFMTNILNMLNMRLDIQNHPQFHRVLIKFSKKHPQQKIQQTRALLALKSGSKKRPLIIIRAGIFSSIEEMYPERFLMMQLFEQSDYHVLVVGNSTGLDSINFNQDFVMGGFEEGLQNIEIARLLKDPKQPLSKKVSQVFLMGLSLGGQGVFQASQMQKAPALISGFLNLCPVADLKESVAGLEENYLKKTVVNLWSRRRLESLFKKNKEIQRPSSLEIIENETSVFKELDNYLVKQNPEFWKLNELNPTLAHQSNFLVLYNSEDLLVNPLKNVLKYKSTYDSVGLKYGNHCTLPISYDWEFIRILLNSFVESTLKIQKNLVWSQSPPQNKVHLKKVQFEILDINKERVLLSILSGVDKKEWSLSLSETPYVSSVDSTSYRDMVRRWVHANILIWIDPQKQIFVQKPN